MTCDWDDAYANAAYIKNAESYVTRWQQNASAYRSRTINHNQLDVAYGPLDRQKMDIFFPGHRQPVGFFVFVHGGYWLQFDKSSWSHLAQGPLSQGWAVVIPSYHLCPQARLSEIRQEIALAITQAATLFDGPICLAGHSAGGHIVTRLMARDTYLEREVYSRIHRTYSISGLHDLRPLQFTKMKSALHLDAVCAQKESPALQQPLELADLQISCWVGADERPEFLRQNALLPMIWQGLNCHIRAEIVAERHHFNILSLVQDPHSELMQDLGNVNSA